MRRSVTALAVLAIVGHARVAAAENAAADTPAAAAPKPVPEVAQSWELAGTFGYMSTPIHGATNPLGAGVGLRLGFARGALYVGLAAVDYLGGDSGDVTERTITYGAEAGYQHAWSLGGRTLLTLRPTFGLGGLTAFYSTPSTTSTASGTGGSSGRSSSVDVVSNASSSSGGGGAADVLGVFTGGGSSSTTTSATGLYLEPAVTLLLSTSTFFVAMKASTMVVPSITDADGTEHWLVWGLQGQAGLHW